MLAWCRLADTPIVSNKRKRPAKPKATRKRARPPKATAADKVTSKPAPSPAPELLETELTFALAYLENGFNATQAYLTAHPNANLQTCASEGWRYLRKPKIAGFIKQQADAGWKTLQMGGEEALARTALAASFDIRLLFNDDGTLKLPKDWPEELAQLVESVEFAAGKVKVTSRLTALRIILEQSGKLKSLAGGIDELAAALRGDLEEHGEASL